MPNSVTFSRTYVPATVVVEPDVGADRREWLSTSQLRYNAHHLQSRVGQTSCNGSMVLHKGHARDVIVLPRTKLSRSVRPATVRVRMAGTGVAVRDGPR